VETFHVANECKTAIYFRRCLVQALAQWYSCFNHWNSFNIASFDSLTDSDITTINRDRTWRNYTFIYTIFVFKLQSVWRIQTTVTKLVMLSPFRTLLKEFYFLRQPGQMWKLAQVQNQTTNTSLFLPLCVPCKHVKKPKQVNLLKFRKTLYVQSI